MPLYKTLFSHPEAQIYVWKITESLEELSAMITLNKKNVLRVNNMKSILHRRAFLSVRKLLEEIGYSDFDLHYDDYGKPHLNDGKHISISHSHEFSTIMISHQNIGIDLEMQREKIIRIADKFVDSEYDFLNATDQKEYIEQLTIIWGAKEAIFKIRNEEGISFKDHIQVAPFNRSQNQTKAVLSFDNKIINFDIFFETIENYSLVYAFENE